MLPILNLGLFRIPSFYLVISLTSIIVLAWLSLRIEKNRAFDRKTAFDIALLIMVFGFIGGRLFHVLYEEPMYYLHYPSLILQFWNGGFVYFGGMILAGASVYVYTSQRKLNFLKWADFLTPLLSLAYALGRFGCLLEGCCYGKTCELPWAVNGHHPTQLYMIVTELVVLSIVLFLEKTSKKRASGFIFACWLIMHAMSRFVIEFFRADARGDTLFNLISISQFISLIIAAIAIYYLKKIQSPKN